MTKQWRLVKKFWHRKDNGEAVYRYCPEYLSKSMFGKDIWVQKTETVCGIGGPYKSSVYFLTEDEGIEYIQNVQEVPEENKVVYP